MLRSMLSGEANLKNRSRSMSRNFMVWASESTIIVLEKLIEGLNNKDHYSTMLLLRFTKKKRKMTMAYLWLEMLTLNS
jgi:hypothetical protein